MFGVSAAMLVVAAIGYTYRDRLMQAPANAQQAASHKPEPANGSAVLSNAPFGGEVVPAVAKMPLPTHTGAAANTARPAAFSDTVRQWQRPSAGGG